MRRILSIFLPRWPIDRRRWLAPPKPTPDSGAAPAEREPFALVVFTAKGPRLQAVNAVAGRLGMHRGMPLADARALLPKLLTAPADPAADTAGLQKLAAWCLRYTPWSAVDGEDGLWLDLTGCANLFGGEEKLLREIAGRLAAFGMDARLGVAETPGAAWALARYGGARDGIASVAPGDVKVALANLPVAALRLGPDAVLLLQRLGLDTIGTVAAMPRSTLVRRFGVRDLAEAVTLRLDQALGTREEPVSPLKPPPVYRVWGAPPEPLLEPAQVEALFGDLLAHLCGLLATDLKGARRLVLSGFRSDGSVVRAEIGAGRATRDAAHLHRLFAERLALVEPGFGIDGLLLAATTVEPLGPAQTRLAKAAKGSDPAALDHLLDRLAGRLGPGQVQRWLPVESHIPERAVRAGPAHATAATWPPGPGSERPLCLFTRPEAIAVTALIPDGPPGAFVWRRVRHQVRRAEGPERLAPEWWRLADTDARTRDYYRVEDVAGRRFWLYRDGIYEEPEKGEPRWFVHGLFA